MDFPRNPPAIPEQIKPNRPGIHNVYEPEFTLPEGRTGLTRKEYQEVIVHHNPLVTSCLNKIRWQVLSLTILSAIGGRFWAKHQGFRTPATIVAVGISVISAVTITVNIMPKLRCSPDELLAMNNAIDLTLYGPWKRESGPQSLFKPKAMDMDEEKGPNPRRPL